MTASPHQLTAEGLSIAYGDRRILDGLDLAFEPGRITAIVGPNGCGKSTLLRGCARLLKPQAGAVTLDGRAIHTRSTKELARVLGLLPQNPIAPEGITVADLVGRGRHPHQRAMGRWNARDSEAVAASLDATGTGALADRAVDELSGGQRQRVWIAMALAQETEVLLLDEPTTYLDVTHQLEVLDLLRELNRQRGTTIVMVLHDLNLAARYADVLVAVREGSIYAAGAPTAVLDPSLVREVFALDCRVIPDPVAGTPLVIPIGRHHVSNPAEATGEPGARGAEPLRGGAGQGGGGGADLPDVRAGDLRR
ncbi:ABC transporter ATP-binding protein [Leucobacter triazinivorans]|uniref:ABC transporter ATP-binding protein n=1 Tax=Leucobacter triazinivorans TaxID=1784719 RepID=A0A4P6KBH4_9MICO|nr:ABC transporter ATP-binding protein [Leucobacter triazinivorans]QBE47462.1 ABC transporter ATP-binding protein [Leucobacter triazinivorans]